MNGCRSQHHELVHRRGVNDKGASKGQRKAKQWSKSKTSNSSNVNQVGDDCTDPEDEEALKAEECKQSMKSKVSPGGKVSIQVGSVRIHYRGKSVIVNVHLDLGSNNSNISEELAETLGMKSVRGPVERT